MHLVGRDVHPNVAERGGRAELNAHVLEGHAAIGHPRHGCDVEPNRQCRHAEVALIVGPGDALALQRRPGHQDVRLSQRAASFIEDSAFDVAGRLLSGNRPGQEARRRNEQPEDTRHEHRQGEHVPASYY